MKILSSQRKSPESYRTTMPAFWAACGLYVPCMSLLAGVFLTVSPPVLKPGGTDGIELALSQWQSPSVSPEAGAVPVDSVEKPGLPLPDTVTAAPVAPEPCSETVVEQSGAENPAPAVPEPSGDMKTGHRSSAEPIRAVKPVKKVAHAKRPPRVSSEGRVRENSSGVDASVRPSPSDGSKAIATPAAMPAASLQPGPETLVVGEDADPFLTEVREAVLSTLEYPRRARRMREEGTVVVGFEIGSDGRLLTLEVHQTSGFSSLDKAALSAVRRAASLWPVPGRVMRLRMPVTFDLRRRMGGGR